MLPTPGNNSEALTSSFSCQNIIHMGFGEVGRWVFFLLSIDVLGVAECISSFYSLAITVGFFRQNVTIRVKTTSEINVVLMDIVCLLRRFRSVLFFVCVTSERTPMFKFSDRRVTVALLIVRWTKSVNRVIPSGQILLIILSCVVCNVSVDVIATKVPSLNSLNLKSLKYKCIFRVFYYLQGRNRYS